ncbi:hypothetical protein Hypma_009401 [Hypsizygus marmoreus]|uniref:Uncharacterized protein n=1 Tax=Hypsizygus marmoreus TaxID=39966 RepID=A0A369JNE8_HYPMA|nr:hypothetical protein Hypma_009401 [Hypsizygus marmoreus]
MQNRIASLLHSSINTFLSSENTVACLGFNFLGATLNAFSIIGLDSQLGSTFILKLLISHTRSGFIGWGNDGTPTHNQDTYLG